MRDYAAAVQRSAAALLGLGLIALIAAAALQRSATAVRGMVAPLAGIGLRGGALAGRLSWRRSSVRDEDGERARLRAVADVLADGQRIGPGVQPHAQRFRLRGRADRRDDRAGGKRSALVLDQLESVARAAVYGDVHIVAAESPVHAHVDDTGDVQGERLSEHVRLPELPDRTVRI